MAKISTFIVAIILVGIFAGVFGMYYADGASKYNVEFDNATFTAYNQLSSIQEQTAALNQTITRFDGTSLVDIIGRFLQSGYSALKITYSSFNSFTAIGDAAVSNIPALSYFKVGLYTIGFIIFVFIIISVLVGRDV